MTVSTYLLNTGTVYLYGCSFILDGKSVIESAEGLHILVYDNIQKKIIDIRELG